METRFGGQENTRQIEQNKHMNQIPYNTKLNLGQALTPIENKPSPIKLAFEDLEHLMESLVSLTQRTCTGFADVIIVEPKDTANTVPPTNCGCEIEKRIAYIKERASYIQMLLTELNDCKRI